MRSAGNKKITRQRKEIFPGYEKIVQDRTKMTEDKLWQEDDENDEDNILVMSSRHSIINIKLCNSQETKNPDNLNPSALSERRSSCNPTTSSSCEMPESVKYFLHCCSQNNFVYSGQLSSDPDLKSHFSRRGLRATVCNAQLNKHRKYSFSACVARLQT